MKSKEKKEIAKQLLSRDFVLLNCDKVCLVERWVDVWVRVSNLMPPDASESSDKSTIKINPIFITTLFHLR